MLWHVPEFSSFSKLNNISLWVYNTLCLSIRLSVDTWVTSTFWILWIMLQWTWIYKYLFEFLFFNSFWYISKSLVSLFLIFEELLYCLYWKLYHFTSPRRMHMGSNFFPCSQHLFSGFLFLFLVVDILIDMGCPLCLLILWLCARCGRNVWSWGPLLSPLLGASFPCLFSVSCMRHSVFTEQAPTLSWKDCDLAYKYTRHPWIKKKKIQPDLIKKIDLFPLVLWA